MPNKLTKEELNDIIQWDVKNWKNALPFWEAHFLVKPGMKVLALGEREGGMSLYFALKGCEVVCSDYRDFPDSIYDLHKKYKVEDKISYKHIDMSAIDLDTEKFDVVVFKSVLGVLRNKEKQDLAMKEIKRVLKKGGALLFAENALGSKLHKALRKKYNEWAVNWRYVSRKELEEWGQEFSESHLRSFGSSAVFGRNEKQRKILGTMDQLFNPITPKNWKYITFGVLIK